MYSNISFQCYFYLETSRLTDKANRLTVFVKVALVPNDLIIQVFFYFFIPHYCTVQKPLEGLVIEKDVPKISKSSNQLIQSLKV